MDRDTRVDQYAAAVGEALRDQPRVRRRDLVADARAHLDELENTALERLDPPKLWAADYRQAIGVEPGGRWRRWLGMPLRWQMLSVGGPCLIVLVIAALALRANYQPLEANVFGVQSDHWAPEVLHRPPMLEYQHHGAVTYDVLLVNEGAFAVEVSVRPDDPGTHGVLQLAEVHDTTDDCCLPGAGDRVQGSVRVEPGETRTIAVTYRMDDCGWYGEGTSVRYEQIDLRARVLGVDHSLTVPLTSDVAPYIDMPGASSPACPS